MSHPTFSEEKFFIISKHNFIKNGTERGHLRHLCPIKDNHKPPDAGSCLMIHFTICVSAAHRGLQPGSVTPFSTEHWHSNEPKQTKSIINLMLQEQEETSNLLEYKEICGRNRS